MAYEGKTLSFSHNWEGGGMLERLSWLSSVLPHRDGTTQRGQFRTYPRRQFEVSLLCETKALRSRLDNLLYGAQSEALLFPIWTDVQYLSGALPAASATIEVDTVGYDFDAGQYAVLWEAPDVYEVVEIESLTATELTLVEPTVSNWTARTRIYPARLARIEADPSGRQIAHDVRPYTLIVSIDESAPSVNRVLTASYDEYIGEEVLARSTEASEDLDFGYTQTWSQIDFQSGVVGIDSGAQGYPNLVVPYNQIFASRTEIMEFLGFLDRRGGQRAPFWFPSYEHDFVPVAIDPGLPGTIDYEATGYTSLVGVIPGRRDVMVLFEREGTIHEAGDRIYRRLSSASEVSASVERIGLNTSTFSVGDVDKIRISFMRYCRLFADTVELYWLTNCYAKTSLKFVEMRDTT